MFNKDAFIIQSGTWESAEQDWRQVDSDVRDLDDYSDFPRQ